MGRVNSQDTAVEPNAAVSHVKGASPDTLTVVKEEGGGNQRL